MRLVLEVYLTSALFYHPKGLNMPIIYHNNGDNVPRRAVKILKANSEAITLETAIGVDYRFSIPKSIRSLIDPEDVVRITIEKLRR